METTTGAETRPHTDLQWQTKDEFQIHAAMMRAGGYKEFAGVRYGGGMAFHTKGAMKALWPWLDWHLWSELLVKSFSENNEAGVMGPGSSGKTFIASAWALCQLYVWPQGTTVIISTTTREGLQLRVWGSIKELHKKAKARRAWLPGKVHESRYALSTGADPDAEPGEGVDFRDGIIGVACRVGGQFVGISNYVGIKNDRIILVADEASLMPRGFLDAVPNLRKNPVFKLIALGNPKDRTDALGVVCEPSPETGGWDGLPYEEKTRTWRTRAKGGIAIQLCGYDTPNGQYPEGLNPFKGIITPEQIAADLAYYGKDSLQFAMMNLGVMPRDGGSRRIITASLCEEKGAFEEAVWGSADRMTRVAGLDAAYSGIGGDRCALIPLAFGPDRSGSSIIAFDGGPVIVPVDVRSPVSPEEQIAKFVMEWATARGIPPENIAFDSTGRGTLMSAFARLWSTAVVPVEFGGKPSERPCRPGDSKTEAEAYDRKVTALWYASRMAVESKQVRAMPREVAEEGAMREWGVGKSGKVEVEPKWKTKERMGRSPDLYDGWVVALEVARMRGFSIASGAAPGIVKTRVPLWLQRMHKDARNTRKGMELSYG